MQLFRPSANVIARSVLIAGVLMPFAAIAVTYGVMNSSYVTGQNIIREQPVPFLHRHHAGELGIACLYCHTSVEKSAFAGVRATRICMTCHSQIWTNAAMLAPVREIFLIGAEAMAFIRYELMTPNGDIHRRERRLFQKTDACHGRGVRLPGVSCFEEPVCSDDLEGLSLIRDRVPAGKQVAASGYGYDLYYFRRMLEAGATDVQQVDATRCLGLIGFLQADALCSAFSLPLSAHCAPALHLHAALAARSLWNQEWFHDHVRIERLLFDGAPVPRNGLISADLSRPGLDFKQEDAQQFAV